MRDIRHHLASTIGAASERGRDGPRKSPMRCAPGPSRGRRTRAFEGVLPRDLPRARSASMAPRRPPGCPARSGCIAVGAAVDGLLSTRGVWVKDVVREPSLTGAACNRTGATGAWRGAPDRRCGRLRRGVEHAGEAGSPAHHGPHPSAGRTRSTVGQTSPKPLHQYHPPRFTQNRADPYRPRAHDHRQGTLLPHHPTPHTPHRPSTTSPTPHSSTPPQPPRPPPHTQKLPRRTPREPRTIFTSTQFRVRPWWWS